jgi:hypothetical protein
MTPDGSSGDRYRRALPRSAADPAPADAQPLPVVAPRPSGDQPALQDPRQPRVPTEGSDPPRRTSLPVRLVNAPVSAAETAGLAEPVVAGEPAPHRALDAAPARTPDARAIRPQAGPGSDALQPRVRTRRMAAMIAVRAVAPEAARTDGSDIGGTRGWPTALDQTPSGQPATVPPSSAGAAGRVAGPGTFGRPRASADAPAAETWSGPRERRRERREVAGGQSRMPRPAVQPRPAPDGLGVQPLSGRRAELADSWSELPPHAPPAAPELRGDDAPHPDDPVAPAWSDDDLQRLGEQLERLLRDEARRHGVAL